MADARTNLSADVEAEARRHLAGTVYQTVIPRSVRLSEAPSHGRSIATYAPESRGGQAYAALAGEFRSRNARYGGNRLVGIPVARESDVAALS
jgi:chromosome partitioning protein